jgi:hypothetical protein
MHGQFRPAPGTECVAVFTLRSSSHELWGTLDTKTSNNTFQTGIFTIGCQFFDYLFGEVLSITLHYV